MYILRREADSRFADMTALQTLEMRIDEEVSWPEFLQLTGQFLRGCGYVLDKGEIQLVPTDCEIVKVKKKKES